MRKVSPLMNKADGSWNLGESPEGIDIGGALGQDAFTAPMPTYEPYPTTPGWHPHPANAQLVRYVGRLRPPNGVRGPEGESPAAFLVVAPQAIATERVVVVLFTQATLGSAVEAERIYDPHKYPGDTNDMDLLQQGPERDLVERNLANAALPFRLVGVQFVPRTSQRPLLFTMQRLRQVRRAVLHLLDQRYGIPEANVAFSVTCVSFGGLTAPLAPLFYPREFHSATGAAYSGAHRSMPSDFDSHVFTTALLGLDSSAHTYNMRDTIDLPMWCSVEQTDFASMSFTNRWYKGHIQRPTYFLIGDEDTVSHGTDWLQILTGMTDGERRQPQGGRYAHPTFFGRTVDVYWTLVSKQGHSEPRTNRFQLHGAPQPTWTDDYRLAIELMAEKAYDELVAQPPILDIDNAALGRVLTDPLLPSLDPNRIPLSHGGRRTFASGTNQNFLTETPTFKRYGQGTWLGANESLKVKKLSPSEPASVFVGSADGFVTRLMMQGRPVGNPTAQPLVEVARSFKRDPNPKAYALGFGTWGLDVGDIDPVHPGMEVAVASYDRVALFDASTLEWIREVQLANWEYTNPRKLQVADLHGGPEAEIVFRTLHNHLVIMDWQLNVLFEHREGGIIDLAIGPTPAPRASNALKRPIYLLSARGHVVRLEFDQSRPQLNAAVLAGASSLQYGGLRDLDVVTFQQQERLAVLTVPHEGTTDAVRFYTTTDCDRVAQFGDIVHTPPDPPPPPQAPLPPMTAQHQSPTGDMEPSFTKVEGHGFDCFVISSGGDISVWDGEIVLGHKTLSTFPPAANHGCVQAGDIDPQSPGDEIVVSTTAGKVVWFKLSDLTTAGKALTGQDFVRWNVGHFVTDGGEAFEHRCNTSLAATWALAAHPVAGSAPGTLHAIDRTGTWWDVDPISGYPTWRRETLGGASLVRSLAPTFIAGSGGSQPHLSWEMFPFGAAWLLATTPYVPNPTIVPPAPLAWWIPQGLYRPFAPLEDGHWLLSPGASYLDASNNRMWVAWWQRSGSYYDLVQRVTYDLHDPGPATVHDVWGSTQRDLGGAPPPKFPDTHPDYLPPLRSEIGAVAPMNYEAIRIARVLKNRAEPQVVVSAAGGRVTLLDGANGRILAESDDYGFGGMALAVADIYDNGGDGLCEVIFAPIYSPIEHGGGSVRAYVHVLTSNTAGDGLIRVPGSAPVPVGEIGNADFQGYGTSGLAVIDNPLVAADKRILVTTLTGELVVFGQTNGVIHTTPIYRGVFEGSLGGYGSIVIENLDPSDDKPELYIAGSSGIRRFDFQ